MAALETEPRTRLADLGEFRNGVNFGKGKKGSGLGLINVKNLFRDSPLVDFESLDLVNLVDLRGVETYFVEEGDLFFVRSSVKREGIGFVAYSDRKNHDAVHCGFVIRFRPDSRKADSRYLTYALRSPDNRERIRNLSSGAAITNISQEALCSLALYVPQLLVQRRIAGILSAYDDLIENNRRRIAILEEMARALYREWIDDGHTSGRGDRGTTRLAAATMPERWTRKPLGQLAQDCRRGVDPTDLPAGTPCVGLEHMPRRSIALGEWGQASDVQSTKSAFQAGEILFGKIRPYFHKVVVAPVDGVCSSDAIVIAAKDPSWFPLVLATVSSDRFIEHATQTSNGTKMPRANWDVLLKYPVRVPPEAVLLRFNAFVGATVAQIQNLTLQNRNLRVTRDLMLPKLISGEVDVSGIEAPSAEEVGG